MRRAKGPRLVVMSQIQPPGGAISIVSVEIVFPFKKKLISLSVNAVNPQRGKVTNMAEALIKKSRNYDSKVEFTRYIISQHSL